MEELSGKQGYHTKGMDRGDIREADGCGQDQFSLLNMQRPLSHA